MDCWYILVHGRIDITNLMINLFAGLFPSCFEFIPAFNEIICFYFTAKSKQRMHQNDEIILDSLPLKLIAGTSTTTKNPKVFASSQFSHQVSDDTTSNAVSDVMESTATDITLSRTPPWQKNSILSQQQAIVNQSNETASTAAQQNLIAHTTQLKNVKQQPPWHDETKRRNMVKKRPNFKEDPTGYLDHQTAILNNSILNLHSPELQDETNEELPMAEIDSADENLATPKSFTPANYSRDIGNQKLSLTTENNTASNSIGINNRMHLSLIHPKHENLSTSYIQQYGKPHIAIGPNGQPVRIIQNTHQIMYAGSSSNFRSQSTLSQQSHPQFKLNETQSGNTHKKIIALSHSQPIANQSSIVGGLNQQIKRSMDVTVPLKMGDKSFGDEFKVIGKRAQMETTGLSIGAPHSVDNSEKNCDNTNQKLVQSQLLVKQTATKSPKIFKYTPGNIRRPQESPVSSSTHQDILSIDEILPAQVGAISTSNEISIVTNPAISEVQAEHAQTSVFSTKYHNMYMAAQTSGRNTITSVLAGKAMTSTTSTTQKQMTNEKVKSLRPNLSENTIHVPSNQKYIKANHNQIIQITKTPNASSNNGGTSHNNSTSTSSSHTNTNVLQNFQQICAEGGTNQIIMTSTGQILMMPSAAQENKNSNQMIISPSNNALLVGNNSSASNLVINTQNQHHAMRNELIQGISENGTSNMIASGNGMGMVIQSRNVVAGGSANILQSPNNSSNYILGTTSNMQSMILNNSGIISHNGNVLSPTGTTLIPAANNPNIIGTTNTTKVISSANNLLASTSIMNQQHVIGHNNQVIGGNTAGGLLSPNNGIVGQPTVVLNQLSNGSYVIQPQTITVDGQVMNVISSDGTNQFMQQRLIVSPDSKRRTIKRKSTSLSPSTQISNDSPLPSPTVQHNPTPSQQMLQITPHYHHPSQSFQISPGGAGITLVQNKPSSINTASQQQILLQNSSILQPINLIGQQLILPTGLMMAPDATTLLQIQNVASTNSKEFYN